MPRTIFLCMLFTTMFISSCKSNSVPDQLKTPTLERIEFNLPALEGEWIVKLSHSGGIMGLLRSIEISSNGKYTIRDERAGKIIAGVLTTDELSRLKEQVASSEYRPASKPDGRGCADCFIYELEIHDNGKKFSVQLNDVNLANSGLESLITYLRGLIEAAII